MTDAEYKAVMDALAEAQPGWLVEQRNVPPAIPERRTFHGPGVIDTGSGGVLIDPPIPRIEAVTAAAPEQADDGGGTSALIFIDCEGNTVARIDWVDGLITTSGDPQTIEGGCTVASSI